MDKRFKRPLLRMPLVPHRVNYHVWSMRTITLVATAVIVVTSLSVFLLGKGSLFRETELTLGIIAAALFAFLTFGLHRGATVKRWDLPGVDQHLVDIGNLSDGLSNAPDLDFIALGAEGGCLGALLGLVLSIFAGVILMILLWIVVNLGIVLWVFMMAALSWVFYLALRQVFAKGEICRGDWLKSMAYALLYTALYTGWLLALVFIADGLLGQRLRHG
jgi:hypothetical protein